jgi:hypothetical protein
MLTIMKQLVQNPIGLLSYLDELHLLLEVSL